jgi:hypothetical protein
MMRRQKCREKHLKPRRPGDWVNHGVWLFALALVGCSSSKPLAARDVADANDTGRTLAARTQAEQQLLARVGSLPSGSAQQLAGLSVIAEPAYAAASGHTCRALSITQSNPAAQRQRIACTDGKNWFFVPDVFGAGDGQE